MFLVANLAHLREPALLQSRELPLDSAGAHADVANEFRSEEGSVWLAEKPA
jgi:hypothetical protein